MTRDDIAKVLEAALMASDRPLSLDALRRLFDEPAPARDELRAALEGLREVYAERAVELVEVASGYRFQVRRPWAARVARLWEEKPQRYSRALLETLALIAYRQPITRGEIEEIRGVAVSSQIMRTLLERGWVRVVGHREVPGRPALYATTRAFLDHFGLARLEELPPLPEVKDLEQLEARLAEVAEGVAPKALEEVQDAAV